MLLESWKPLKGSLITVCCRESAMNVGLVGVTTPRAFSGQFSSVAQSCPTLCDPMNHSTPCLPVQHQHPEVTQTRIHRVSDAIQPSHPQSSRHLILCHPLLLLPPIPSSIRVFSNGSTLHMRWPKYWSFILSHHYNLPCALLW